MQPFDYVTAVDSYDYRPFLSVIGPLYGTVVSNDSNAISSLEDLRGKIVGTPPESAAVTRLIEFDLANVGVDVEQEIKFRRFISHSSCLQSLVIKDIDVCVTQEIPIQNFESSTGISLSRVLRTTALPHIAFVVAKNMEPQIVEQLRVDILSWPSNEQGQYLLDRMGVTGFIITEDAHYDAVRNMVDEGR